MGIRIEWDAVSTEPSATAGAVPSVHAAASSSQAFHGAAPFTKKDGAAPFTKKDGAAPFTKENAVQGKPLTTQGTVQVGLPVQNSHETTASSSAGVEKGTPVLKYGGNGRLD